MGKKKQNKFIEKCIGKCEKEEERVTKGKEPRLPVWKKECTLNYEKELKTLQMELLKLQNHVKKKGLKVLIIFEGRDAAGKGGTIKRIMEHLNPRGARVVALGIPSDVEKTQWYFQRYTTHLPSGGEITLFDRSWYNRAGVEPVMGFCTEEEHARFLHEVPFYEEMQVGSGTHLIKFYLTISKEEQAKRFHERQVNPLKNYKISPIDIKAQELWDKYTIAKYAMLLASHTEAAPWTIVNSDIKKNARINVIKHILSSFEYEGKSSKIDLTPDQSILYDGGKEIIRLEKLISGKEKT
ncbi:polyphosphate kinase 2 [Sulfurovum lithotrophicum]|uniref:polyphosphate kinase 2 n=1 Tax=Sulfurovum lithotrophicum TaxID=206403 RepID=UPI000A977E14|nr:polyphosphate kinase 2 [Sulfurovum lithotrophicum]